MAGRITEYANSRTTFVDGDLFDVSAFLNPGYESQKTTWLDFKNNLDSAGYLTSVALNDLTDATISAPLNGQALVYNSGSGDWENTTLAASDTNIILTNSITATANRTHDLATFNMTFNNVGLWTIGGNTQVNGNINIGTSGGLLTFADAVAGDRIELAGSGVGYDIGISTAGGGHTAFNVPASRRVVNYVGGVNKASVSEFGLGVNNIEANATHALRVNGKTEFLDRVDLDSGFSGQKMLIHPSSDMGFGVQPGEFQFTTNALQSADFTWVYGLSGASTELMRLDAGTGDLDVKTGVYRSGGTAGVTAGPYTTITSITVTGGIITAISGS